MPLLPNASLDLAAELIDRYDISGPRYTSYPTAPCFSKSFNKMSMLNALANSARANNPLSLYVHLPFCESLCYYCGCNKVVTHKRQRVTAYIKRLEQEMAELSALTGAGRVLTQLHWGGGTPTYLTVDEMRQLMQLIGRYFLLVADDSGDYAIEVHPGQTSVAVIAELRSLGFNRISLGVQDFYEHVQKSVNRFNSESDVEALVVKARDLGFKSVSMDLIYGLPGQTAASFAHTVRKVIGFRPDRISVFSYAHMPEKFKSQRLLDETSLPPSNTKLEMFWDTVRLLTEAGYRHIGMDHFALPEDGLAKAQQSGRLHRNFQGYSTHGECDLIGVGVSAISSVRGVYWQNVGRIDHYQQRLDTGNLPIERGYQLSFDDQVRRYAIHQLMCHYRLRFADLERLWGIEEPAEYFAESLQQLQPLEADGLVCIDRAGIEVSDLGRLFIRRLCMAFDAYLGQQAVQFSKVI